MLRFCVLVILFGLSMGKGVNYIFQPMWEDLFRPCAKDPDNFLDKLYDMSNLNVWKENNLFHVNGTVELLKTLKSPLNIKLTTLKKSNSGYEPTFFNMERRDVCKEVFKSSEPWYRYTKNITPQLCPATKGTVYTLATVEASFEIELNSINFVGEYLVTLYSKDICLEIMVEGEIID